MLLAELFLRLWQHHVVPSGGISLYRVAELNVFSKTPHVLEVTRTETLDSRKLDSQVFGQPPEMWNSIGVQ